jgi:hypothetical protein
MGQTGRFGCCGILADADLLFAISQRKSPMEALETADDCKGK